jgi:Pectate lyase superfamily protein
VPFVVLCAATRAVAECPKSPEDLREMLALVLCALVVASPPDGGVLDVKTFGAKGDGARDDSAAIQAAIDAGRKNGRVVFFPDGTYLISESLRAATPGGEFAVVLEGESRKKTVIRLRDAAAGFTEPLQPRAVIEISQTAPFGYGHMIRDLTIDVGKRNAGAVGVQLACAERACVRGVTVRSGDGQGKVGLDMTRVPLVGPVLVKDVRIIGFDFGARTAFAVNGMIFENVALEGQARAGMANEGQCVSIRGLTSRNSGPALINAKGPGLVALLDCDLQGLREAAGRPAVENEASLFARGIASATYREPIHNGSNSRTAVGRRKVEEFTSQPIAGLISAPGRSLNLPVKEAPDVAADDPKAWTNVTQFRATADDEKDDSAAIQEAIDLGAPTILFPAGRYVIRETIRVRGAARRLIGRGATLDISGLPADRVAFQVGSGSSPVVVVERFAAVEAASTLFENASTRTLVLKDGSNFSGRMTGSGDIFLENISTSRLSGWRFGRQNIWARLLSIENPARGVVNDGGALWILGLKAKGGGTLVETRANGRTEILGGLVQSLAREAGAPAFSVTDGSLGLFVRDSSTAAQPADVLVRETRGGKVKELKRSDLPKLPGGSFVSLSVGSR